VSPFSLRSSQNSSSAARLLPQLAQCSLTACVLLTLWLDMSGCSGTPTQSPILSAVASATESALPSPSPSPMAYLPPLQYFLSPRSQLVSVSAADVDDDGIEETIVLYRDGDRPGAAIRGFVAEPPTESTPTPQSTTDGPNFSDVYWLGGGEAAELFHAGEPGMLVADINSDGRSELLLQGGWDEEASVVHVFQWNGAAYTSLLTFQAKGDILSDVSGAGTLRFTALQPVFPRSGIVTYSSAEWDHSRYLVQHRTTWESEPSGAAAYPEAAVVNFYEALAAHDWTTAYALLGHTLQSEIAASALAERGASLPGLLLGQLRLTELSATTARAEVDLTWSDPDSGRRREQNGDIWDLSRQDAGWRLQRLNGTPSPAEWRTFTADDGLAENRVTDLMLDDRGRLWMACGDSGITLWAGSYWTALHGQDQGLPSDTVRDMLLDGSGRFWFATPAGLASYDGLRWVTYTTADGLPNDAASGLALDRQGRVWAATQQGAAYFDAQQWHSAAFPTEATSSHVTALAFSEDGVRWLGLASASPEAQEPLLARSDNAGWRLFGAADGFVGNRVTALSFGSDGTLWAATASDSAQGGSLGAWTGQGWHMSTSFGPLVDAAVYDIAFDASGAVWIGTAQGAAYSAEPGSDSWTIPQGSANGPVWSVLVAPEGDVYFGTDRGLTRFREGVPLQVIGGGQ
jgi:hypothetical protein